MTLTLGYKNNTEKKKRLRGVAVPVIAMGSVLAYSSILGNLVNYSANQDLTVHAYELSRADAQEAAYALPAEQKTDAVTILDGRFPSAYINADTDLLASGKILSASIGTAAKRSRVYMMETGTEYTLVLEEDGTTGFVRNNALSNDLAVIFDDADMTKWVAEDGCVILDAPADSAAVVAQPLYNEEIHITGTNDQTYWRVSYGDITGYMDHSKFMDEMYVEPEPEPVPEVVDVPAYEAAAAVSAAAPEAQPAAEAPAAAADPAWDGSVLTAWAGVVNGPSGKETYYNLNMNGVIALMQAAGYYAEYWVRSDGVKMYGDYVMAACGFDVRPRGTIVETSLGTAICADTGTFSYTDPYQIDIAVDW